MDPQLLAWLSFLGFVVCVGTVGLYLAVRWRKQI